MVQDWCNTLALRWCKRWTGISWCKRLVQTLDRIRDALEDRRGRSFQVTIDDRFV
jgi:hypothetical protein